MFLFNKLIRTDLLLVLAVILLFFVHAPVWRGILQGFVVAAFLMSILNHVAHYKQTKKFY